MQLSRGLDCATNINYYKINGSDNIFFFVAGELKSQSLPRGFPPQIIVQQIDDEGKV